MLQPYYLHAISHINFLFGQLILNRMKVWELASAVANARGTRPEQRFPVNADDRVCQ